MLPEWESMDDVCTFVPNPIYTSFVFGLCNVTFTSPMSCTQQKGSEKMGHENSSNSFHIFFSSLLKCVLFCLNEPPQSDRIVCIRIIQMHPSLNVFSNLVFFPSLFTFLFGLWNLLAAFVSYLHLFGLFSCSCLCARRIRPFATLPMNSLTLPLLGAAAAAKEEQQNLIDECRRSCCRTKCNMLFMFFFYLGTFSFSIRITQHTYRRCWWCGGGRRRKMENVLHSTEVQIHSEYLHMYVCLGSLNCGCRRCCCNRKISFWNFHSWIVGIFCPHLHTFRVCAEAHSQTQTNTHWNEMKWNGIY